MNEAVTSAAKNIPNTTNQRTPRKCSIFYNLYHDEICCVIIDGFMIQNGHDKSVIEVSIQP